MLAFFLAALEGEEDQKRFTAIYNQYHTIMEEKALHIVKNQDDAEDAVQYAFLQVIKHFEKVYRIPCDELPYWLLSIVKNEALKILRKRRITVPIETWDGAQTSCEDAIGLRELAEIFYKLPNTYRDVLEMKILIGYTDREIAEKLGISLTAVSTRVSRGRILLQQLVKKEGLFL